MQLLRLRAFATDAASQLNVLRHDGHALGMDSTKVRVFKESNEVSFSGFLQGKDSRGLEAKIRLEILGNLADKTLERKLTNQEFRRLLVLADLPECDRAWTVAVGLLHTSSRGCRLARRFGRELLARGLTSSTFTSGLLRACHFLRLVFAAGEV